MSPKLQFHLSPDRRRLSPLVRDAQAQRAPLRLRLFGGGAGAASHACDVDVDSALVSMEMVAGRQTCRLLLNQCNAGTAPRLAPRGFGAAVRTAGKRRHPTARCRADLFR